ncbi:hypothetical protein [Nocardioides sp.]|uniref:hypothetical protein n=1 Tax=Nocardioides sp. TaxID=35761 RepID=UPI002BBD7861|nr:hypothetical protein [Nocardioides sp.]HXH77677.1 hypothetical protein [Nocardioides sp.]
MADARISADNLGAWLIKCQPRVNPELPRSIRAGDTQPITRWCVADNYRSRMMGPGDRAVLWVSGDGRELARGIWGLGWVTGPVRPMVDELGVETDKLEVPLHLPLLSSGLRAEEIKAAGVTDLEVLRLPQGSNPSWVSLDQLTVLAELVDEWPPRAS